jgi:hypothetical protein
MIRLTPLILILAFTLPASASGIISWSPQVIEYIYVNDTVSETIEYSVTTSDLVTQSRWTVDGQPVDGGVDGNTYYYNRTWENRNRGFHTVNFNGNHSGAQVEFRWYVNVYEIGGHAEGSIFDIIDDSLDDQALNIKVRMFRYGISGEDNQTEFASRKARQIQDAITSSQMKRESLTKEFKEGNIKFEEYVAAMKQVQKEGRFYMKLSTELADITRSQLNNEELGREFENFSLTEKDWAWHDGQVKDKSK